MVYIHKSYNLAVFFLFLSFASCASKVTRDFAEDSEKNAKWELITVQADYIDRSSFLAVTHLDGEALAKPLIFGIDVILLPPGEHELRFALGTFESYEELKQVNQDYEFWAPEAGRIQLQEPIFANGRNYLVASYDKIYASNTNSPEYMQQWIVNYPRNVDATKNWSIEPLDPKLDEPTE